MIYNFNQLLVIYTSILVAELLEIERKVLQDDLQVVIVIHIFRRNNIEDFDNLGMPEGSEDRYLSESSES